MAISELLLHSVDPIHVAIWHASTMDDTSTIQATCLRSGILNSFDFSIIVLGVTRIAGINKGLNAFAIAGVFPHDLLVSQEGSVEFFGIDVVQERAGTYGIRHCCTELAVPGLEDGCCTLVEDLLIELVMVHGQASTGKEIQDAAMLEIGDQLAAVGESRRVRHVNGYGMPVAQRRFRDEFMQRGPSS